MPVFKDAQQIYEVLGSLWKRIVLEQGLGDKLKEFEVSVKFNLREPNGTIWIGHDRVLTGEEANRDAVITMDLSGDTAHQFWLKRISLPVALATRKIVSRGPIPKVLKILPFLKPVYEQYPDHCRKLGFSVS